MFRTAQLQLNNIDRTAILDGVIVDGWRVGGLVHVELQVKTNCMNAPPGRCFEGTIGVRRASDD